MFDQANAEQITDPEPDRSCLSNDEVVDLASGRATTERLAGIRAHVDRCGDCQRLVTAAKESSSSGPHPVSWGATFREGDVVARRYRIHRFVARGGMGEVYDAFDRDLHERVALKTVLSTSVDSFRAVRRLRAEVQLAHRVSHPNVCRIYDLGTHVLANGAFLNFLTMEFIDGESLRARIERGKVTPDESVAIARQLLLGLSAAHAAGILHRDFKSENVMLRSTRDAPPSAVIMDFGLASPIDTDAARLTSGANGLVGTPCYMSPEQLEGATLSAASDLYSFGVVWFEMLTGELPFSLRAPFDRLRREAARPSRLCAEVPASLDAIIGKCLARNCAARFTSAKAVLEALDAGSARVRPQAPSRRRVAPGKVAAAAVAAALLGGAALRPHRVSPGVASNTAYGSALRVETGTGSARAPTSESGPAGASSPTRGAAAMTSDPLTSPTEVPQAIVKAAPRKQARRDTAAPPRSEETLATREAEPQESTTMLAAEGDPERDRAKLDEPSDLVHREGPALAHNSSAAAKSAKDVAPDPSFPRVHREQGFLDPFHRTAGKR